MRDVTNKARQMRYQLNFVKTKIPNDRFEVETQTKLLNIRLLEVVSPNVLIKSFCVRAVVPVCRRNRLAFLLART